MTGHIEDGDESFTPELTDVVRRAEAARHGREGISDLGLKSIMVAAG
ncbi:MULTISPECIES: hypothetical protein [unclassified Bradyrhizobium]|nr:MULTISPECIES: hypothetical protein [unclassified Bradyrhizobium]MCP3381969.1 hypothetical protein [Bradyrhizobium sp. CCGUVB4N]MCP3443047.1 hypothetical protein [Bradyrhizobium sp. CCGUVB14]WFU78458.1 hypothetical protein QA645_28460 [Bradyrhizobium sp. CIAT3101]